MIASGRSHRRAVVLATVLLMVAFLALVMASYVFFIRAEAAGTRAYVNGHQARLVALSALDELTAQLGRQSVRRDFRQWFDVPESYRHALIWARDFDRQSDPVLEARNRNEAYANEAPPIAWRYSLVAPRYDTLDEMFRYGITAEAGKLNLNAATEAQIRELMQPLLTALNVDNPEIPIASLLDWLDSDQDPREYGAELEYYTQLDPPYVPKDGALDTVEELLLVRGITAAVLWGEDVNRNGLLETNEDDGDESFPPYDNSDGLLDHGIAPFVTVSSREMDVSNDNRARISLRNTAATVRSQIEAILAADEEADLNELSAGTINFISSLAGTDTIDTLRSPLDLYIDESEPNVPAALASSPVTLAELPIVADRFSLRPVEQASQPILGRINLNTAPRRVLALVPGMDGEMIDVILANRETADLPRDTIAWPIVEELVDPALYKQAAPYLTASAYQFHVEVLAYGDHTRLMRRYEYIIEMQGPVAQFRYYRDLTSLGPGWPLDREMAELVQ
jgi:type II secretory pathway component PulK